MEPTTLDVDAAYNDYEVREQAAYNLKVQQMRSSNNWTCQNCNRSNSGGFKKDKMGLHGEKCVGCKSSTLLIPSPRRNQNAYQPPRGVNQRETNRDPLLKELAKIVEANPLPKHMTEFHWRWIHPEMRAVLKHPASRHQILDALTMFLATPKPAAEPSWSRWDMPPMLEPELPPCSFKYSMHPWKPSAASGPPPSDSSPAAPEISTLPFPTNDPQPFLNLPQYHPHLIRNSTLPRLDAAEAIDEEAIKKDLSAHIDTPSVPVATAKLFSDKFCRSFMEYSQEMEKFPQWREALRDLHGIPAKVLGLTPLFEGLAGKLTIAAHHVSAFADYKITFTHGFTLSFAATRPNSGHFSHIDDADLTINTCFGGKFEGAQLELSVGGSHVKLEQNPQISILHSGYTNHSSLSMSEGFRQNLILFFSVEPQLKFWGDLPDDTKLLILSLAPTVPKFLNYSVVSKAMRKLVRNNEDRVWPALYRATFKKDLPAEPKKDSPKDKFRKQYNAVLHHFQALKKWDQQHPPIMMKALIRQNPNVAAPRVAVRN